MRLEKASYKAVRYACMNFHYAKSVPAAPVGFSVFNDKNEWCGVIVYGLGVNPHAGKPYGLMSGQFLELTRMALNGKQESTSKAMSISIKLIKKMCPSVKLLISYADKGQNHTGTIYQATNWYYVEDIDSSGTEFFLNGKWRHDRSLDMFSREQLNTLPKRKKPGKFKYVFPIDKSLVQLCKDLSKPYIKKQADIA